QDNLQDKENFLNSKHTPIYMYVGKLDYKFPLNEKLSMEAGVKGFMSDVENKINVEGNQKESSAYSLTDQHVLMDENIGAAYLDINATLDENTALQAALRFEHTYTNLQSFDKQPMVRRSYGEFFPSFAISRDF